MTRRIREGDKVRILFDNPPDEWGVVVKVYRAKQYEERRALVRHPDAEMGSIWPIRRLEVITDTSILPENKENRPMTDPAAPTTEAGRRFARHVLSATGNHCEADILAIEAEAQGAAPRAEAPTRSTPAEALDVPSFAVEVRDELTRARSRFGQIASLHEGYAVILEELDEFWEDVRSNDPDRLIRAYRELVQVAAMAQRTAEDAIARLRSPESDR